jgi:hypothetical protein
MDGGREGGYGTPRYFTTEFMVRLLILCCVLRSEVVAPKSGGKII